MQQQMFKKYIKKMKNYEKSGTMPTFIKNKNLQKLLP
jgi:hypothetical protein